MTEKEGQPTTSIFKRLPAWAIAGFVLVFTGIGIYAITLAQAAPKGKPGGGTTGGSAQLYLTNAPDSVNTGETFTVAVRINPPSAVDGIESTITYDASQLQYVSIDSTGSAFPVKLAETGGNGTVQITRGIFAPETVSSDSLVSNVSFKALKSARNSQLQVQGKASAKGSYLPSLTTAGTSVRIK